MTEHLEEYAELRHLFSDSDAKMQDQSQTCLLAIMPVVGKTACPGAVKACLMTDSHSMEQTGYQP